jgi:hypothetical protein
VPNVIVTPPPNPTNHEAIKEEFYKALEEFAAMFVVDAKILEDVLILEDHQRTFIKLVNNYLELHDFLENTEMEAKKVKQEIQETRDDRTRKALKDALDKLQTETDTFYANLEKAESKLKTFFAKHRLVFPDDIDYTILDEEYGVSVSELIELIEPYLGDKLPPTPLEQTLFDIFNRKLTNERNVLVVNTILQNMNVNKDFSGVVSFIWSLGIISKMELIVFLEDQKCYINDIFAEKVLHNNIGLEEMEIRRLIDRNNY